MLEKKTVAESCDTLSLPDTRSSGFASCSYSQSSNTQKAKVLDTHLPSLKRRRLSKQRDKGTNCMPVFHRGNICWWFFFLCYRGFVIRWASWSQWDGQNLYWVWVWGEGESEKTSQPARCSGARWPRHWRGWWCCCWRGEGSCILSCLEFVEKIRLVYTIGNLTVVNVWYSTIIGKLHTMLYSPCLTWASTTITDASDNNETRYIFLYDSFLFIQLFNCALSF